MTVVQDVKLQVVNYFCQATEKKNLTGYAKDFISWKLFQRIFTKNVMSKF